MKNKMKKIIIYIVVIFMGFIVSKYILQGCLYIIDVLNLFSDNSRLLILFVPFFIYGIVLFVVVPYTIKCINEKSNSNKTN